MIIEIRQPNEQGSTLCEVRWMVETQAGWIGSWERQALEQFVSLPAILYAPEVNAAINALRDLVEMDDAGMGVDGWDQKFENAREALKPFAKA